MQCKRLADLAKADLDEAMPALEEAIKALDSLSKKDISEMKSYATPPQKVKMVMEAVNILKGVKKNLLFSLKNKILTLWKFHLSI